MLAPYVSSDTASSSGWRVYDTKDILLLIAGLAVAALIAVDLFVGRSRAYLSAAAAIGFVTLGLSWADFLGLPVNWDVGAYLVLLAALLECAAAVLALLGPPVERPIGSS